MIFHIFLYVYRVDSNSFGPAVLVSQWHFKGIIIRLKASSGTVPRLGSRATEGIWGWNSGTPEVYGGLMVV